MPNSILIVDDENSIRLNLERFFSAKGFHVRSAADGKSGLDNFHKIPPDVVLLDLRLPDMSGLDILEKMKTISPGTGVIMFTAYGDVETAVKAMQMKADNFILKPIDLTALEAIVMKVLESYRAREEMIFLKQKVSRLEGFPQMKRLRQPPEVLEAISLLAEKPSSTVMVLGETGTGKGLVAKIIHEMSERKDFPFVDVNCAGLNPELLETELFGHEKGAFTDAKSSKRGLLEVADGGSLLLDEVGELSLSVQAKLLKVIEERTFRRLGGTSSIEVNVRIMAATNSDLEKSMKEGKFRKDLFYRLNVMPVVLPPLRERKEDILPMAWIFLEDYNTQFVRNIRGFQPEAEGILTHYSWPGNCRELRNVIERAVLICDSDRIRTADMPSNLTTKWEKDRPFEEAENLSLEEMERQHIRKILANCGYNNSRAARVLGINRSTLLKKIKKYQFQQK